MDRRHVIWVALLFIIQDKLAEGQLMEVCASCHPNATCEQKLDGSGHTCICMYGFVGNGRTVCQDKDECQIGAKKICGPHTFCRNTLGSYQCTCVSGYSPSNTHTTFIPNDGTYCQDVDECLRTPGPCGAGGRCINLEGDFECVCLPGYMAPTEPFNPLRDRGSCRAVDCGRPPPREGAAVLSSNGTAYGSVALWGCQDGFLWRQGENTSRCGGGGAWSGPGLVCEEVSCGNPPVLPHTGRLWNGSSSPGTIVFYYCNMGFHEDKIDFKRGAHDAANMSVCNIHGHWTGPNILCKAVDCGMPPDAPHAIALWGKVSALGSTVIYQCEPGYHNAGQGNRSVCSASGEWSPTGIHCQEIQCGEPLLKPHAELLWDGSSRMGSVAYYRCEDGYRASPATNTSVCTENGRWQESDLRCQELRCGVPPTFPHTNVLYDGRTTLYLCAEGYYQETGQHGAISKCSQTEEWEHVSLKCRATCGPAPQLARAEVVWSNASMAMHRCVDGYRSWRGSYLSVCGSTGDWQQATLRCTEVSCGHPPVLPHTGRLWNGSSSPGTVVFYYCNMGFHEDKIDFKRGAHDAANMSVCNIHGHWTGPNILCKAVDCGMPPDAPHTVALWGKVSALGSTVIYQCEPGYHNAGQGNRSVCSASGEWSPTGIHCQEIQCGEPLLKPHAELLWDGSSRMGSVAYYRCEDGYRASPATNTSVCTENGRWQESDLRCQELTCGVPPTFPHTNVLYDGRTTLYLCAEGYYQETGQHGAISKCSQTGEWEHVSLKCRATCGPAPQLARAEVVWSNASMAMHRCVDGYRSWRGSYLSVCGSTGDWQQATLRCTEVKPAIYDLQVFNERCVRWRADKFEADKEIYKVVYRGTREYQATFRHERKQFLSSWDESVDVCLSLLPTTNYTVSISALSTRFTASVTTNTSLQAPQVPLIFYRELDTHTSVTLTLKRSAHTLDAISVYQVFVVPLDGTVVFDCKSRASPEFSPAERSPAQYVAGQFPLRHMGATQMNFTVGDGRHHGGFFNAPLRRGINYYVILRVASRWQEGFQSSCVLWVKVKGTSYVMTMTSLCAAGLVGALLLVVLLGYSYTWFFNRSDAL